MLAKKRSGCAAIVATDCIAAETDKWGSERILLAILAVTLPFGIGHAKTAKR